MSTRSITRTAREIRSGGFPVDSEYQSSCHAPSHTNRFHNSRAAHRTPNPPPAIPTLTSGLDGKSAEYPCDAPDPDTTQPPANRQVVGLGVRGDYLSTGYRVGVTHFASRSAMLEIVLHWIHADMCKRANLLGTCST